MNVNLRGLPSILLCLLTISLARSRTSAQVRIKDFPHSPDTTVLFGGLNLAELDPKPGRSWVVASITPGPRSGGVLMKSAYIDAATGHVIRDPAGQDKDVLDYTGSLTVLQVLSGRARMGTHSYHVTAPWGIYASHMPSRFSAPYAPFEVLVGKRSERVLIEVDDMDPILNIGPADYVIPGAWRSAFSAAVDVIKQHPETFRPIVTPNHPSLSPKRDEDRIKLIQGDNPFLAVAALFATLPNPDPAIVKAALAQQNTTLQAILLFDLILNGNAYDDIDKVLDERIAGARNGGDLLGIALACNSVNYCLALTYPPIPDEKHPVTPHGLSEEGRLAMAAENTAILHKVAVKWHSAILNGSQKDADGALIDEILTDNDLD